MTSNFFTTYFPNSALITALMPIAQKMVLVGFLPTTLCHVIIWIHIELHQSGTFVGRSADSYSAAAWLQTFKTIIGQRGFQQSLWLELLSMKHFPPFKK